MLQILEVVLPYLRDVKTLLVCSTLSQQSQQLVQDAVRLNLAPLVKQLPSTVRWGPWSVVETAGCQLLWLCSTAGHAAVNTHDNACAVLWTLSNWPDRAMELNAMTDACRGQGEQRQAHCLD
jgi:hypothetical protein